ncbi:hypothetical protein, partial [Alicyclobacillus herbarius]|uniref:hypothetical protein n=1 Tax=Alicyclobacillus herbarius TaxID=122960 RepID=UPI003B5A01B7
MDWLNEIEARLLQRSCGANPQINVIELDRMFDDGRASTELRSQSADQRYLPLTSLLGGWVLQRSCGANPQINIRLRKDICGGSMLQRSCGANPQINQTKLTTIISPNELQRSCGANPQINISSFVTPVRFTFTASTELRSQSADQRELQRCMSASDFPLQRSCGANPQINVG